MTDKDLSIMPVATNLPSASSNQRVKPAHLIKLTSIAKDERKYFISLDIPDFKTDWIVVKGIYSSATENDIISKFSQMLNEASKEHFVEVMFPTHRVISIQNLVYKKP